jgi:hypothetical protein
VACSVIVWLTSLSTASCDRPGPPEDPVARPPLQGRALASTAAAARIGAALAALAADAGLEPVTDPVAPSGDLKSEVEAFTNLDACVRSHRLGDALLADAIDALGYDTFTRDACRVLQALKVRRVEPCQAVAFAALRARCETQVAALTGNPALCPDTGRGASVAPRDPTCVARAARDPRLCMAALETERASCRALITGDLGSCGSDRACLRQTERWSSLREKPAAKPDLLTACRVELSVDGSAPVTVDLSKIAEMGAVLRDSGRKLRLLVGRPKTSLWARPSDPWATPQLYLDVAVPRALAAVAPQPGETRPLEPTELGIGDLTLDLLVPQVAALSAVTSTARRLSIGELGAGLGAGIELALDVDLTQAPHAYHVTMHLQTFVRESPGAARVVE